MILATDLDGTFLGGTEENRKKLYGYIKNATDITLIFVTGRGLASILPLFDDPNMPIPDYIISDVGGTIVHGSTLQPVLSIQEPIAAKWPGAAPVVEALKHIDGLQFQDVPQQHRASFFANDEKIIAKVEGSLAHLEVEVIYSAGKFLDILPKGVNKGSTLVELINYLQSDPANVLVAGDTLNDLSMYKVGYRGVVVGNAEERLVEQTRKFNNIHFASAHGAGGILEAIF